MNDLYQQPEKDEFKNESPIRAFTGWTVNGRYALGKGFRPSLQHLVPYLHAMESKEGWRLVQILEAATGSPSFVFRQEFVPTDDVLIERLKGDEGFKQQVRDLLRGEEPYVDEARKAGFAEAGEKMDAMRDIAEKMELTEINGHRAYIIRGLDPEAVHYTRATWTAEIATLQKAMGSMTRPALRMFLDQESAETQGHYWATASVASVLRLIDRLDWWDRITIADPISLDAMAKALGHEPPPGAIGDLKRFVGKSPALGMPYTLKQAVDNMKASELTSDIYESVAVGLGIPPDGVPLAKTRRTAAMQRAGLLVNPDEDDPINPKHYAGRECADIGERLSANGYQVLKYCWRLGKKDDPCQELGKAIWYGESELNLIVAMRSIRRVRPNTTGLKPDKVTEWFEDRINGQPQFTRNIARMLWAGYGQRELRAIIEAITEHRFHLDCGRGLAI